jgi:hypothetical protein
VQKEAVDDCQSIRLCEPGHADHRAIVVDVEDGVPVYAGAAP